MTKQDFVEYRIELKYNVITLICFAKTHAYINPLPKYLRMKMSMAPLVF